MNTQTNTTPAKVIVLNAHLPEQMAIVAKCVEAGYPVTFYADELTEDVAHMSRLTFVQSRIFPINALLLEELKAEEGVVVYQ